MNNIANSSERPPVVRLTDEADRFLDEHGGLPEALPPWPPRDNVRVTAVRSVVSAPDGRPFVVVRVDTSEPGLYGLGCATFTQRYKAVATTVDEYLAPLVIGRHPADIEDITRLIYFSSYWRNGPVLNNALSGIDQALWDIAGKRAGMPVYELLGGRSRAAVEVYGAATGATVDEALNQAEKLVGDGYRHIRLQCRWPGNRHVRRTRHSGQLPEISVPRWLGRASLPRHHA